MFITGQTRITQININLYSRITYKFAITIKDYLPPASPILNLLSD